MGGGNVSIHAPAWGATTAGRRHDEGFQVSIHAPAWGATPIISKIPRSMRFQSTHPRGVRLWPPWIRRYGSWFQSTHPRGVRRWPCWPHALVWGVSIHAPAWGATTGSAGASIGGTGFNPRTRVGCDEVTAITGYVASVFQSTHPRGVRRVGQKSCFTASGVFQSTHPRGVRHTGPQGPQGIQGVSIHAPAWGATAAMWAALA